MEQRTGRLYDKVLGCLLGGEIGDAMGAPAEGKTYREIAETYGELTDFSGFGTDDSALKHILCDAIAHTGGYPTADAWAGEWLAQEDLFLKRRLFWIPVMNGFWKIRGEGIAPRQAGEGNMASSSSAMCISPLGIINAANPRQAALETYEVASPIHHNYCRDAACSMAAAVAAAFHPDASAESVVSAALDCLPPLSARVMREYLGGTVALAREAGGYALFRERYYAERILPGSAMPDSRETVPVALSLFLLAGGDPRETILYGANFGRDADTIASMAGALAGAFCGASALPQAWVDKVRAESPRAHSAVAEQLVNVIARRTADLSAQIDAVERLL
ncbi:MAG: ADP-ribosylglycohydrolase family protein [Chloroflexi bacterium]|nr:ADP-ribosylglycohydrolase family protein [Chloroflexota bacterium]